MKNSLEQQRLAVRQQLAQQREVIASRLSPGAELLPALARPSFPRSLTMRLLMHNPAPALKLVLGLTTLVIGARASSAIRAGVQVFNLVRSSRLNY
jgi:hypothetical protein